MADITLGDIYKDKNCNFIRIAGFISDLSKPYDSIENPLLCLVEKLFELDGNLCSDPGNYKYCTVEYIEDNYTLYKNGHDINDLNVDSLSEEIVKEMQTRYYIPLDECC